MNIFRRNEELIALETKLSEEANMLGAAADVKVAAISEAVEELRQKEVT